MNSLRDWEDAKDRYKLFREEHGMQILGEVTQRICAVFNYGISEEPNQVKPIITWPGLIAYPALNRRVD